MSKPFSLFALKKDAVGYIRQMEAELSRGDRVKLETLDRTTDQTLLRKWCWIFTIVGIIFSFGALPLLVGIVQIFSPPIVRSFLWICIKICMGACLLMFGTAIYFTILKSED